MSNQSQLNQLVSLLTGEELIIALIVFVVFSYLLIALLTWSLHRPLKYLSIPFMIVGIIVLIIRFILPTIANVVLVNTFNIPTSIFNTLLNPITKMGITCFLAGIISLVLYIVINKLLKKISNKEIKTK